MNYKTLGLTVALSLLAAPAAFAAQHIDLSGLVQPGSYQSTMQTMMDGKAVRTRKHTSCLTKAELANYGTFLRKNMAKSGRATVTSMALKGNHLNVTFTTPAGSTAKTQMVFDDSTHSHSTTKTTAQGHKVVVNGKSHRVGACKK